MNMPVRQSAKFGRLRNSAAVLKPNPNFIPDFKTPSLTLTPFCIYIVHSTVTRDREMCELLS